ncbi:hypothetical protein niasHT_031450 [Heterodera trifolii]|uniref:Uncharacterized protein n=1 Tax=Heterodera trifolii TaxID=157864 RepID=A0ABD2IVT1_9BILA
MSPSLSSPSTPRFSPSPSPSRAPSNSVVVLMTDWRSIFFVSFVVVLDFIKVSVIQMNSWPYLKSMDPNVGEEFYGVAKSAVTFGTILASLASGYISNYLSDTKPSFLSGILMSFFCSLLYANLEILIGQWRKWAFLVLEFLIGCSGGALIIWRTQLAVSSTDRDRQKATALLGIAINLSFILGPVIVISTKYVFPVSLSLPWHAQLSIYTAPVYSQSLLGLLSFVLLGFFFDGRMHLAAGANAARHWRKGKARADIGGTESESAPLELTVPRRECDFDRSLDHLAIFACFVVRINFCAFLLYVISLSSPFTMAAFNWSGEQAVIYTMLTQGVVGIIGLLISIGYAMRIFTRFKERKCILASLCLMLIFFLVSFPWPFLSARMPANSCAFSWCDSTPTVNVYVYHVALVICLGFGMPVGQVNLDTLYSRMLGPIKQGTMQGMFFATGESMMFFGPPLMNVAYKMFGPQPIWIFEIFLFFFGIVLWLLCYHRLMPNSESFGKLPIKTTKCGPLPTVKTDGGLLHADIDVQRLALLAAQLMKKRAKCIKSAKGRGQRAVQRRRGRKCRGRDKAADEAMALPEGHPIRK